MSSDIILPTTWRDALSSFHTLVNKITDAYDSLLLGLLETQRSDGGWPTIYLDDRLTHHWTVAQCLIAMLTASKYPKYLTAAIDKLMSFRKGVGWVRGDVAVHLDPNYLNVYCTADALWALLLAQKFTDVPEILEALQNAVGDKFGYGVIDGDDVNKVRPTCWALNALLVAYQMSPIHSLVNDVQLQNTVAWLEEARSEDGGWGFLPRSPTSNPTATSWGIYTLLLARENGFEVKTDLRTAIDRLNRFHELSGWRGVPETFEITVNGEFVQRHRAAGLGTTVALLALAKAAKHDLIEASNTHLIGAIISLTNSVQAYEAYPGKWIIPSGLGEERPTIWDSCYAILALHDVTDLLMGRLFDVNLAQIEQLADLEWGGVYSIITELGDAVQGLVSLIEAIGSAYSEAVWRTLEDNSPPQLWQRIAVYIILLAARAPLRLDPTLSCLRGLEEQIQPIYKLVRFDLVITKTAWDADFLMGIFDYLIEQGIIERVSGGWRACVDLFDGEVTFPRSSQTVLTTTRESRRAHLVDHITQDLSLLKEYEDALRLATEPREKTRYKQQVVELKNAITENQRELALLEQSQDLSRTRASTRPQSRSVLDVLLGAHAFLRPLRRLIRDDLLILLGFIRFSQENLGYDRAALTRQCRLTMEAEGFMLSDERISTSEGRVDVIGKRTDYLGSRTAVGVVFEHGLDSDALPRILNYYRELDAGCEGVYLYIMAPSYSRTLIDELAKVKSITVLQPSHERKGD